MVLGDVEGSPSITDRFYHLLSRHQDKLYLKIFLPISNVALSRRIGERTHNRPLEQGLGRLSINGYLIIASEESDTKLILQRAVLNTIRLMSHFYDKYFVVLPYFPERKFMGDKCYLCTSFPKKINTVL